MSIEAIAALSAIQPIDPIAPGLAAAPTQAAPAPGFADWFGEQLAATNDKMAVADQGLQKMALGEPVNLHQVMIDLEEAKMSMQLVLQVRNRLLDAYQDVMRMQM